ncbi:MAG: bifunctional glutamate N-acetyltransferase/amino-acid acetyltransferase ArgJ [Candidatus Delongbacteria bacterium]|nr:bifunctional glutamate N-acetyltransferase/amino-acid acetyltransferase ArgJ [Candidatus Delongbacteria bacterium]
MINEMSGGITAAAGYSVAGVHAGLKKSRKDMALIVSRQPAATAALFTTNKVVAAPVEIDRDQLAKNPYQQAILINSGSANACTGRQGLEDARSCIRAVAEMLKINPESVLVASTGVIGQPLKMDIMHRGIQLAGKHLKPHYHLDAAQAIMTTDTFPKEYAVRFSIQDHPVSIGGMAKGSGMIKPNMATMLGFITTDACLSPDLLQSLLREAVESSFNRISVDNDTSTNDMVVLMANGLSSASEIKPDTPACELFRDGLVQVCQALAKMIVRDGEGATKLIEIRVQGARTREEALQAARSVADSMLVKTAIHGEDANWGRIIAAVGYSGIEFQPDRIRLSIGGMDILLPGYQVVYQEEAVLPILQQSEISLCLDLNQGSESERVWTSDLSKDYITINAHYRS